MYYQLSYPSAICEVYTGNDGFFIPNKSYLTRFINFFPSDIKVQDLKDVTPICIKSIDFRGLKLQSKKDILLALELDDSKQLICAEKPEIGLSVYAETRENLIAEINEQIGIMWQEYALCHNSKLTADAIELKTALKSFFKEVARAS